MPKSFLFVLSLPAFISSLRREESDRRKLSSARRNRGKQFCGQLKFCLNPWDCFEENSSASLRYFLLAMTFETADNFFLGKATRVHEQVPNTNIKFICPEFKEKMFLDKKPTLHEFSPNTNTKLF
jgi:hypothetical protein